jgi:hypothetical protein
MQWNYFKIKNKIINDTHMYMVKTVTRLTNVMKTCWQKRKKNQMYHNDHLPPMIFPKKFNVEIQRFKCSNEDPNHNDNWLGNTTQLW